LMARNRCRIPGLMCKDLGCDFYVFSGHKVLGRWPPAWCGAASSCLTQMPPYHVGSNMAHEVDFEHASFEHGALKFQAGTPDVAGPVGLAAAIDFLSGGWARSQRGATIRSWCVTASRACRRSRDCACSAHGPLNSVCRSSRSS
jgi:selenocysteine lyase/cysteine desulfurase